MKCNCSKPLPASQPIPLPTFPNWHQNRRIRVRWLVFLNVVRKSLQYVVLEKQNCICQTFIVWYSIRLFHSTTLQHPIKSNNYSIVVDTCTTNLAYLSDLLMSFMSQTNIIPGNMDRILCFHFRPNQVESGTEPCGTQTESAPTWCFTTTIAWTCGSVWKLSFSYLKFADVCLGNS